jgi:uncharacterized protein (TIGR02270 family)
MNGTAESTIEDDGILWNFVEEHLDEGEFAFAAWTRALESGFYTLETLRAGPEERLVAHVDGLTVAGSPVARRLLEPELTAPAEARVERLAVVSLALVAQGRRNSVQLALGARDPIVRRGARLALALLGDDAGLDAWLALRLELSAEDAHRPTLLELAAARGIAQPNLLASLQNPDPEEVAAAARAARHSDARLHLPAVESLAGATDAQVRGPALVSALALGSRAAFERCMMLAADAKVPDPLAMLLVALLGDRSHHEVLVRALAKPQHRPAALRALGFSGHAGIVDAILPYLLEKDPLTARLAAEAIANITGLDVTADAYVGSAPPEPESLPPLEDDDLDANLVPTAEDELPLPNGEAIASFWRSKRSSYDPGRRLLRGQEWSLAYAVQVLRDAPMRQRHPVALWLEIRSGAAMRVDTRALSHVQRAQLERVRGASARGLVRAFWGP